MRNHVAVEGIEIDYQPQYTLRPWFVYVARPAPRGKRSRKTDGCFPTLAEARARQGALMKLHDCPGWSTTAAAKQSTDEDSVAELVADGMTETEAWAQVAEWRRMAEAMTAGIEGVV